MSISYVLKYENSSDEHDKEDDSRTAVNEQGVLGVHIFSFAEQKWAITLMY